MAEWKGGRIEANALVWPELTAQQQGAVERAAGFLLDAVDRVDAQLAAPSRPAGFRKSEIIFIDGDRGTGKTTALLSLRMITTGEAPRGAPPPSVVRLREQRSRIVWLETLDLEPLRSSNLFGALLVRLEDVLGAPSEPGLPLARHLEDGEGRGGAVAALQQLQHDAVLMWDRPPPVSEPHVHVHNVLVAEKAGMDVNPRMSAVLDRIGRVLPRRTGENPVFVLPVDDFDLAPTFSLELLQMVRILAIPRLVFVVAGNVRLAEAILQMRMEGELSRVGGSREDARPLALEIAANNMRKLLPPSQRLALLRLDVGEALALPHANLRECVTNVRIESNQAPTGRAELSLLDWFGLQEGRTLSGGWRCAAWLAGTPRQVHDRAGLLGGFAGGQEKDWGDGLLRAVLMECRREIREDWVLPPEVRRSIGDALELGARLQLDLAAARISVRVDQFLDRDVRLPNGHLTVERPVVSLLVGGETVLPESTVATLTFAHDLAVSLWGAYFPGGSLAARAEEPGPRVTAWWSRTNRGEVGMRWPVPDWWSFRDLERFAHHWSLHSVACGDEGSALGAAWLAAMLEVVMDDPLNATATGRGAPRLKKLLGSLLAESKPKRIARQVLRRSVLRCVLLLAAPESAASLPLTAIFGANPSWLKSEPDVVNGVRLGRGARWAPMDREELREESFWRLAALLSPALAEDERQRLLERLPLLTRPQGSPALTPATIAALPKTDAYWTTWEGRSLDLLNRFLDGDPDPRGVEFRGVFGSALDPTRGDVVPAPTERQRR